MLSRLLLAVFFGLLIGVCGSLARAHEHSPPATCLEWCDDAECKCWERCSERDAGVPSDCTKACNSDREVCDSSCNGGGT